MVKGVYVIAEIGINHEGSAERCAEMIRDARRSGADAVKLQTIDPDVCYVQGTESYKIFKGSTLTKDETSRMFEFAKQNNIDILTTCGDINTARWVDRLNPSGWKISSGLLTHTSFVRQVASFGRQMIMSTGLSSVSEIDEAVRVVESTGNTDITILQCTSLYPAPETKLNLSCIQSFSRRYPYKIGYSDHSEGIDAAFLSVAAGASVIEKHFTYDTSRCGYDHHISLEREGFSEMVKRIRLAEVMMGVEDKELDAEITNNRKRYLRTIVATRPLEEGDKLTEDNIGVKRPMPGKQGADPKLYELILGKEVKRSIGKDEPVAIEDIQL